MSRKSRSTRDPRRIQAEASTCMALSAARCADSDAASFAIGGLGARQRPADPCAAAAFHVSRRAASSSVAMSATDHCTAWFFAIGLADVWRRSVRDGLHSSAACPTPSDCAAIAHAAAVERPACGPRTRHSPHPAHRRARHANNSREEIHATAGHARRANQVRDACSGRGQSNRTRNAVIPRPRAPG